MMTDMTETTSQGGVGFFRRHRMLWVILVGIFLFWWLAVPALQGYHIGCNASDSLKLIRLGFEWCK